MSELRWKWYDNPNRDIPNGTPVIYGGSDKWKEPRIISIYSYSGLSSGYYVIVPEILPPEPELRLPEGWTSEEIQYGRCKDWHIEVLNSRDMSHVKSVIVEHPDKATAIRAAQAAVDAMEGKCESP